MTKLPFVVCIPSYSRAAVICKKTLAMLNRYMVPHDVITVYVVDEQYEQYQEELKKNGFTHINISKGPKGLKNMRNHITSILPDGQCYISIDDDVDSLYTLENIEDEKYPLTEIEPKKFIPWIIEAFTECKHNGSHIFGIYPVKNGFFMKDLQPITYDLRFIVGAFWGCINCKGLCISIDEKEDFERTLLCYERDKLVIRYNRITLKTSYYKTKGGMQEGNDSMEKRKRAATDSCKYLLERFPLYCKFYGGKKNGVDEIRLINRKV